MQRIAREFLGFYYENNNISSSNDKEENEINKEIIKIIKKNKIKNNYFKIVELIWWIIIPFGMILIFVRISF
jgi:hypothetical protein